MAGLRGRAFRENPRGGNTTLTFAGGAYTAHFGGYASEEFSDRASLLRIADYSDTRFP